MHYRAISKRSNDAEKKTICHWQLFLLDVVKPADDVHEYKGLFKHAPASMPHQLAERNKYFYLFLLVHCAVTPVRMATVMAHKPTASDPTRFCGLWSGTYDIITRLNSHRRLSLPRAIVYYLDTSEPCPEPAALPRH